MSSKTCSSDSCNNPGGRVCAGCRTTPYCSKDCQEAHWRTHRLACPAAQKYNCYLIHAPPNGEVGIVYTHIEPFHLEACGREATKVPAEVQELKGRLGWRMPLEAGRFHDHRGSVEWYYWVYADAGARAAGKPLNVLSKRLCYWELHGDLAVVRSRSSDETTPELFSTVSLAKTIQFYETESCQEINNLRDQSRMGRTTGLCLSIVPVYFNYTPTRKTPVRGRRRLRR